MSVGYTGMTATPVSGVQTIGAQTTATNPTSGYTPPAASTGAPASTPAAQLSPQEQSWLDQWGYQSMPPQQQQALLAQWNQNNPSAAGPASAQPSATATSPATTAAAGSATTANPLQPTYLPNPPTAQATTYTNTYDPTTATNELNQAASVQDTQQNQNLMSMLAAQGISPGSSAAQAADQNLATTQTAALAPSLVSAQEYGAGLDTQTGLANASASNTMTQQNLQDLLQTQQYNASAANTAGQQQAGYENQDWLALLEAQLGLQQTGLSTSGSLAGQQANQTVPLDPSLFSQVTGAASAAAPFFG